MPPGDIHQYHALTFGWLAGEIVRRISGKGVDEFFAERITRPLGVEAWIGTPESELSRVAQLYVASLPPDPLPPPTDVDPELASLNERAMTLGSAMSSDVAEENAGFDSDVVRQAVIPGAGGIATAVLATIWSATVSDAEQIRLLNDGVITDMTREQSAGSLQCPFPGHGRDGAPDSCCRQKHVRSSPRRRSDTMASAGRWHLPTLTQGWLRLPHE